LKLSELKIVVWKDTQAQILLPECIFSTLKTALKSNKKCENTKNCQYFEKGWEYSNILKISTIDAILLGVLQGMITGFKLSKKKLDAIFKVVKMSFGSRFLGISFHTAILQS